MLCKGERDLSKLGGPANERFGFVFKTLVTDAGQRRVGRFTCAECGSILDVAYVGHKPPLFFVQKARREGWAAHEQKRNQCYCPQCLEPKGELKVTTVTPIRQPTTDERLKIRGALDSHFDDSKGEYLDGYSDEKIAAHLNVPRIMVSSIREAAYGPIRNNPQISALREQVKKLQTALDEVKARLEEVAKAA